MIKNIKIFLLVIFFYFPVKIESEGIFLTIHNSEIHKHDTVYITGPQNDSIISYYQTILEKTNSQLNLWWNPYGVLIAFLGILFTILTIISAVIIYRQSSEYKNIIQNSILNYQNILNKLIKETQEQTKLNLEHSDKILTERISELTEKLDTVNEEQRLVIEGKLKELKTEKETIDKKITNVVVRPEISYNINALSTSNRSSHICSNCGLNYIIEDSISGIGFANYANIAAHFPGQIKTVVCPKCGHKDTI